MENKLVKQWKKVKRNQKLKFHGILSEGPDGLDFPLFL
uniref:Uncharacterized protein n=1 Tax=Rhizophora mucronata TaxID=61149 RepID=A0A2P2NYS8_RHIMU